jgi:DnaJ domain
MLGGLFNDAISFALSDASLLALSAALPALLILYVRYSLKAKELGPDLSLGKLETIELQRAVLLYEKALGRREEIFRQRAPRGPGWRAWFRGRAEFRSKFGVELAELDRYARDLRSTIMRLRGRPIQRFKSWIHVVSSQSALGRALCCYCAILALMIAASYCPEPLPWLAQTGASLGAFAQWQAFEGQAFEGRLLVANSMAAGFLAIAMPPLYLARRVQLYRWNKRQVQSLREFAAADPEQSINQRQDGDETAEAATQDADEEGPPVAPEMPGESAWFDVLGVSSSATINDVKQAYKALVKRSHPDRVHDMSPVFRELAEAETKRINIAYAEALMCLRQSDLHGQDLTCAA